MSSSISETNDSDQNIYDKYKVDNSSDIGPGRTEMVDRYYGQLEFGVNGDYVTSANCDPTRSTENDKKATDWLMGGGENEVDDSQGGQY